MKSILIGDLILDNYIFGDVDRLSPEAPVPVLNHTKEKTVLGGALNVGRNLNNLNNTVNVLGIAGEDSAGNSMRKIMKKDDIQTDYIIYDNLAMTSKKTRFITNSQQLLRWDVEKNTYSKINEKKLIKTMHSLIDETDFIVISDYNKGVCSDLLLKDTIKAANHKEIKVLLTLKVQIFINIKMHIVLLQIR